MTHTNWRDTDMHKSHIEHMRICPAYRRKYQRGVLKLVWYGRLWRVVHWRKAAEDRRMRREELGNEFVPLSKVGHPDLSDVPPRCSTYGHPYCTDKHPRANSEEQLDI